MTKQSEAARKAAKERAAKKAQAEQRKIMLATEKKLNETAKKEGV